MSAVPKRSRPRPTAASGVVAPPGPASTGGPFGPAKGKPRSRGRVTAAAATIEAGAPMALAPRPGDPSSLDGASASRDTFPVSPTATLPL